MELPLDNVNIFNTVINDINAIQSRYDSTIITLNSKLRRALLDTQNYEVKAKQTETELEEAKQILLIADTKLRNMKTENDVLKEDNRRLVTNVDTLKVEVNELKKVIENLEQDKKDFTRVSHVVAMEKENNKLRTELTALKAQIAKLTTNTVDEVKDGDNHNNNEVEGEESLDVFEKKIKGIVYYVSSKEDCTIYTKNDDGTLGEAVGYLEKDAKTQKTKVKWTKQ